MTTTIKQATKTPSRKELVAKAVALQPLLRDHSSDGDIKRRQADDVMAGLSAAGFFRLLTPARFGGFSTDLRTVLEITETLGAADGSAAWIVGLGATASWLTSLGSDRLQQEIFGADPDVLVSGSLHPAPARRVDGGLVVSGRWPYASGSPHATWGRIAAVVLDDAGEPAGVYLCAVPATELRIEDTWHVVGMRGTGSMTWAADDLFVPDHRLMSMAEVAEPAVDAAGTRRGLPFASVATLALLGPLLGMGQAVLSTVLAAAGEKGMHHTVFGRQRDSVGVQIQVADAALALQTARMHGFGIADALDASLTDGTTLTYEDRARMRAACGYAAQQVLTAIETLVNVHGAASFAETSTVQRYWRDANTAARHAGLNAMVGREVLGKALLGVQERISPMV